VGGASGLLSLALWGLAYRTWRQAQAIQARHALEAEALRREASLEAERLKTEGVLEAERLKLKVIGEAEGYLHQEEARLHRHREDTLELQRTLVGQLATLSERVEELRRRSDTLSKHGEQLLAQEVALTKLKDQLQLQLSQVSGWTRERARAELTKQLADALRQEAAIMVRDAEAQAKDQADKKAREILTTAIQRCAVDHAVDATVSVVTLPSEDIKGRIIGREGRNIRALEAALGLDLIVDDTPEAVILSSFDPVRREVARITLERLLADGRIHPSRIDEVAAKAKEEVEAKLSEDGERAALDAQVVGLHPELLRVMGRLRFRTSYGQNVLSHSVEVAHLAGAIAAELGADVVLARRAGFLHDIGKALSHEVEGPHALVGGDLVRRHGEPPKVVNAVAAHHLDVPQETVEAVLVQVADAISASRPGARRDSLDVYVKRLAKLERIATSFPGVDRSYALQAGREIRIVVHPDRVDDAQSALLAREVAKRIEGELEYPGQIKVTVLRETRATEFAR
jgi:ribonuclease Y